jgi:hypothetical protein
MSYTERKEQWSRRSVIPSFPVLRIVRYSLGEAARVWENNTLPVDEIL